MSLNPTYSETHTFTMPSGFTLTVTTTGVSGSGHSTVHHVIEKALRVMAQDCIWPWTHTTRREQRWNAEGRSKHLGTMYFDEPLCDTPHHSDEGQGDRKDGLT